MFGKILKYLLRGVLVVVLLLALLPALLYVPGVQRRIVSHAEVYLSRSLGMDLSIGRIRLAFPLHLTVDRVVLLEEGDTLLRCLCCGAKWPYACWICRISASVMPIRLPECGSVQRWAA